MSSDPSPEREASQQPESERLRDREREREPDREYVPAEVRQELHQDRLPDDTLEPTGVVWEQLRDLARRHPANEQLTDSLASEIVSTMLAANFAQAPDMQVLLPELTREITEVLLEHPHTHARLEGLWRQLRESLT